MTKSKFLDLARDVGMEDGKLLQKLKQMGMKMKAKKAEEPEIKVSPTEERVIERDSEKEVVEKRVKPTVIRRRTHRLEVKEEPPAPDQETAALVAEKDLVESAPPPESVLPIQGVPTGEMPPPGEAKTEEAARETRGGELPSADDKPVPVAPVATVQVPAPEPVRPTALRPGPERPSAAPVGREGTGRPEQKKPVVDSRPRPFSAPRPLTRKELREREEQAAAAAKKKSVLKKKKDDGRITLEEEPPEKELPAEKEPGLELRPFRPLKKKVVMKAVSKKTEVTVPKPIKRVIRVAEVITVADLARRMGVKSGELIKKLMGLGMLVNINQMIDADVASLVASGFGYEVEKTSLERQELLERKEDLPEQLLHRPPVVTIMGHVDHGKTMLLDAIRKTNVMEGEAGGITQHIGAYDVELENGHVAFIDTPGHEAFTAMRARGAQVTDIVVLVVAADDGVMPQTKEAIDHARAANVPIVVAINKIDKPTSNPDRVRKELAEYGLMPEQWGGTTLFALISAKQKTGIKELLELILLQAEVLELKANPDKPSRGVIIEAKLDKGRGPVATLLVQEGTLKPGDVFIAGTHYGRVRAMFDDRGQKLDEAGPSKPVEVLGFPEVPEAGEPFIVVTEERLAKQISIHRQGKQREKELGKLSRISLEELYSQIRKGEVKELSVVVKADVQGSIEALKEALRRLPSESVKVNVLHDAVGGITETDVNLASASNAIIIGFNVRPVPKAQALAEQERVDIRCYSIIYDAIDDIKKAMEGLLEPTYKERVLGRAEVREVFKITKVGTIAGSLVINGKVVRGSHVRLLRDNVVIHDGRIGSLRRFKDDAREVLNGQDCGIGIENFNDVKPGDVIESYEMEEIQPHLA